MDADPVSDWMNSKLWFPVAVFIAGIACVAAAIATGEAEVDLVVIFPVFSGSSALFLLGTGLIVMSFLLGFVMLALSHGELVSERIAPGTPGEPATEKKTHYGGVVLIGPVPIAFGSDRRTAVVMLILGIAMAVVLISALLMLG